ncbi:MAG: YfgM family protein [Gammaproteobacteria bacterium]
MAIYDSEEEQLEAVKRWWRENGRSSIVGVVLGIALILGWNYWRDYKLELAGQASNLYAEMVKAFQENKNDSVNKIAERLRDQYANTEYATYGGLLQAKLKVQQGDIAGAKALLQALAAGSDSHLSHVVKLRLVRLMLTSGDYENGLQLISEVDPATESGYSGEYDELTGDLLVAMDRLDEARTSYEKALRSGHSSPLLKLKMDDLTLPEKIKK